MAVQHKLKTPEVRERLKAKHHRPGYGEVNQEWSFYEEVTLGGRRIDALAFNRWQSRGYAIHAFEIKVSRADWLRELKDGGKAEAIYGQADYFWLVVGDRSIVFDDELPETWGLMVPHGKGLKVAVPATKLNPMPLDRELFMRLMTKDAVSHADELHQKSHEARQEGYERGKQDAETPDDWQNQAAIEWLEKCENAGVYRHLSGDNLERFAKFTEELQRGWRHGMDYLIGDLQRTVKNYRSDADKMDAAIEILRQAEETRES